MPGEILQPDFSPGASKLERNFIIFHNANPHVCRLCIRFAYEFKDAGHSKCSIKLLYERVRWEIAVSTKTKDFKLNNNHHSYYARLIMLQEPALRGFFRIRRQRQQCTFGPPNEELPPGEHVA